MTQHEITENREGRTTEPVRASQRVALPTVGIEPVQAAETILRRFAARAITLLTSPRTLDDGRVLPPRLSANDCYVALEEACRKMARVALRKWESESRFRALPYAEALNSIFPDPPAYLTRCIRSVVSDSERAARRDVPTISMDQPIAGGNGDGLLTLRDTFKDETTDGQPEESLIASDERTRFRRALATALDTIPKNYLTALQRDMARDRDRQEGIKLAPETDKERQTVCRARAALSTILQRECGDDNPFVRLLAQQRSRPVRQKPNASPNWTSERQNDLFRRLLNSSWTERAGDIVHHDDNVEEAIVNDVSHARQSAPPSPEMRQAMRVMDTFTLGDNPTAESPEAQALYVQARTARQAGKIEDAIRLYRQAYALEPRFWAAQNEVGVLLSQTGNLRDALKIYLGIVDDLNAGHHRFIAATNAADIYLTWFDAGRNRERNIERAAHYAKFAMQRPTPMRACNLILAFVKDRYYQEAQQVMDGILHGDLADCAAEKFLQTLFQIRDADLVAWWNWLDSEMASDTKEKETK